MPDIGRWNGIDQLAEAYLSTSTYAYVANNPILRFDVDGRWFNDDGTINTSGHTPGFVSGHQYLNSFLGANNSNGGGGNSGYTLTGNGAISAFNFFKNGRDMDDLSFKNGYMSWWTDEEDAKYGQFNIWKYIGDGLMEFTNKVDNMSSSLRNYEPGDFFQDTDKHLNGGLGIAGMALDGYNKLPNALKRQYAYNLSKLSPFKSGKIFQGVKAFSKSAGKITRRLGVVGTALSVGVTAYEFGSDTWDAHSVINAGMITATAIATFATAPAIVAAAPFILGGIAVYGVADYMFNISDKIDENVGRESSLWDN